MRPGSVCTLYVPVYAQSDLICARPILVCVRLVPICARSHASAYDCKRVGTCASICARTHPYARTLHFFLSTVDLGLTRQLYISYRVPANKLKEKLVKKNLYTNVRLKRTDEQVCSSVCILNGHPNLHVRLVKQPCLPLACILKFQLELFGFR